MATPPFLQQSVNAVLAQASPGRIRLATIGADGTPLDLTSTGSIELIMAYPAGNANPVNSGVDLTSNVSKTFDSTGVNITFTEGQATTIVSELNTLSSTLLVWASNDSSATKSLLGKVNLTIDPTSLFT